MHIEFLVEEPSAEAALRNLLPKILHADLTSIFIRIRGKRICCANSRGACVAIAAGCPGTGESRSSSMLMTATAAI